MGIKESYVLRIAKIGGYRRDDVDQYIDKLLNQQNEISQDYEKQIMLLENQLTELRIRDKSNDLEKATEKNKKLKEKVESYKEQLKKAEKKIKKLQSREAQWKEMQDNTEQPEQEQEETVQTNIEE